MFRSCLHGNLASVHIRVGILILPERTNLEWVQSARLRGYHAEESYVEKGNGLDTQGNQAKVEGT